MLIADLHCDTISAIFKSGESLFRNSGHFDLERGIRAGIGLQIFALFVSPAEGNNMFRQILKQVDYFHEQIEANSETAYMVCCSDDMIQADHAEKIGCLLHLEGADALGGEMEMLRLMHRMGLRSLGLTWNHRNLLADGVMEGDPGTGLSNLGRKMVKELYRLGMVLDLAHAAPRSFYDALEIYPKPVMISHANSRSIWDHQRNLSDDQLRALAHNNGIIGLTLVSDFVARMPASIDDFLDHMVYISELIGVSHVALGSDFDGASNLVMPGIQAYCGWESLLSKRGFTSSEQEMVLGGNATRFFKTIL